MVPFGCAVATPFAACTMLETENASVDSGSVSLANTAIETWHLLPVVAVSFCVVGAVLPTTSLALENSDVAAG